MVAVLQHPSASELVERILTEQPIGMQSAAKLFGSFRDGRPAHPSTISRWITAGVVGIGGNQIKLDGVRIAGRLVTSRAAIVRFLALQQDQLESGSTPASRRRTANQADTVLDAARI